MAPPWFAEVQVAANGSEPTCSCPPRTAPDRHRRWSSPGGATAGHTSSSMTREESFRAGRVTRRGTGALVTEALPPCGTA